METNQIIKRPVIEISQPGNIFFSASFLEQMKYLCSEIATVEWSGLIFYTIEGNMQNLKKFTVLPYYIHLMHKGSSGETEFDDDGSLATLYKAMPELDPFEGKNNFLYGKIHSHHNMSVFHSGTDQQDLQDQAGKYDPYYLSVIVNNRMDLEAKIAFTAEIPNQKIVPAKFKGEKDWYLEKKEVLGIIDLDVETEQSILMVSDVLKERTAEIIKEANKPKKTWYQEQQEKEVLGLQNYPGRYPNSYRPGLDLGDFEEEEEEQGVLIIDKTGTEDQDAEVLAVRFNHGRKTVVDFINTKLNMKENHVNIFGILDRLSLSKINSLFFNPPTKPPITTWFNSLSVWQQQNVLIFITDEEANTMGDNTDTLFEAIYELMKNPVI